MYRGTHWSPSPGLNLHVHLLHLVLHVKLLPEHCAALVVHLLHQACQVLLAHGGHIRHLAHLGLNGVRNGHGYVLVYGVWWWGGDTRGVGDWDDSSPLPM